MNARQKMRLDCRSHERDTKLVDPQKKRDTVPSYSINGAKKIHPTGNPTYLASIEATVARMMTTWKRDRLVLPQGPNQAANKKAPEEQRTEEKGTKRVERLRLIDSSRIARVMVWDSSMG